MNIPSGDLNLVFLPTKVDKIYASAGYVFQFLNQFFAPDYP
jgi:hypothetical protein